MTVEAIEHPPFHASYAVFLLILILGCISICKPKDNYLALYRQQFDGDCNRFCLARIQYWTVRYIFHYAKPFVAAFLFVATIVFIVAISVFRVHYQFLTVFSDLKSIASDTCGDPLIASDLKAITTSVELWNNQVTWLLTAYFFQKMFSATVLVNGGVNALMAAVIFDPWLFALTIWSSVSEAECETFARSASFVACYEQLNGDHVMFGALQDLVWGLTFVNIFLWIMVALSLSISLLLEWLFTTIRETQYCFDPKYWKSKQKKIFKEQQEKQLELAQTQNIQFESATTNNNNNIESENEEDSQLVAGLNSKNSALETSADLMLRPTNSAKETSTGMISGLSDEKPGKLEGFITDALIEIKVLSESDDQAPEEEN